MVRSVTVVGGGLIGLCSAYFLREAGFDVTVLERGRVGGGASRGNAGEICPDLVTPLPAPGVIGPALRGLPRQDSALYVRPRPSLDLVRFLARFARNTTRRRYAGGVAALGRLAAGTFGLFDEMAAAGADADPVREGFLFAFGSAESARAALAGVRRIGAPAGPLLAGADLAAAEPALGPAARAGFLVADQRSVDPALFVDRLAATLRQRGVRIVEGARVTAVGESGGRARARGFLGDHEADAVVIAAGVWSTALCRRLGVGLDLFPGKGYSFSVDAGQQPRRVIHLGDARVVLTPMGQRVRVAGTMEFDRDPEAFSALRVEAIAVAARDYLRGVDWTARRDEWVGARVMTPDGLPVVGAVPGRSRILVASGHNMLGLMLGPATGRLVADLLCGRADARLAASLDPARLARRVRPR
ncbi:NAD(P)/FAD-dependent oxidoreductase [Amycolatopsis suaedae]|uniref:FAD-dependent oxidoreductase n=1 Tax=Amycolatopsis suaedae TaxID=2510978 RepID=A0A4V2EKY8_9PSEU|nr:FAD-dependent oxidoreductase [Amycolatopsis suaedae]RZQ59715.1 FAD-dependent oxidoreductase [Amycolatopsis suaedae]